MEKDKKEELKEGDRIKIGSDPKEMIVKWKTFNIIFSSVTENEKKEFLTKFLKIGKNFKKN